MSSFDKVEDELSWELGAEIAPKYLGDDMTLLLGLSDTKAEEMVNEESQRGTTPFYSLEKWNPNIRTGNRLIWALCWGIPLVVWDIANIRKIVAAIGDLVEVDDDVEELRRLDRARVLIRTPWRPALQHTVNLHIGGEVYQVHIVEEATHNSRKCSCSGRSSFGSSEEISSFVGDTDGTNLNDEGASETNKEPPGVDGSFAAVREVRGKPLLSGGQTPNVSIGRSKWKVFRGKPQCGDSGGL